MKSNMKTMTMWVGILALAGTIVPPAVFMVQSIAAGGESASTAVSLGTVRAIMLVSTVAWFAAAPFWMKVEG